MGSSNSTDDLMVFNFSNPETLEEARNQLKNAKHDLELHPTYHNAASVQHYQLRFDKLVEEARNTLMMVEGELGLSTLTPYEVLVSAMKEVNIRAKELQAEYGHYWPDNTPFLYIQKVAEQALKVVGEK